MAERNRDEATRRSRNIGLRRKEARLQDPESRAPRNAAEQEAPEPERPTAPVEEQDIARLENPPQTDGPRERSNRGV